MSHTKTALLVDDNDELRDVTLEHLEEKGFRVTVAASAEAALRSVVEAGEGFGLLVSDVYMPGMNGVELADRLLAGDRALAVLLISSRGGEPEIRRRLGAGDVAFLAKPFSPDELAAKVTEAYERVARRGNGATLEAIPSSAARQRSGIPKGAVQLAAALVLVLGLGVAFRNLELGAPPLPAPANSPMRSAIVEVVMPLGPLAEPPAELVWLPVEGASSNEVSLRAIDGTALWQTEVDAPPADIPAEVEGALHRAVTYYWSVEALDAEGRVLARSELAPFVIELANQPDEPPV